MKKRVTLVVIGIQCKPKECNTFMTPKKVVSIRWLVSK